MRSQGLLLVPVKLYNKHRLYKLELALAKAKRKFEKRESVKKKDVERDIQYQLKDSNK